MRTAHVPVCIALLALATPRAWCQQAHTPEAVAAQPAPLEMPLAAAQVKPARRAMPPGVKAAPPVTIARPIERVSYEVPVAQEQPDTEEEPLPPPKFSLIPSCPQPVPKGTFTLVREKAGGAELRQPGSLANRLRLASDEDIIFYGVADDAPDPETLPPGLPPVDRPLAPRSSCDHCCQSGCVCSSDFWRHRSGAFGEAMILKATGVNVPQARYTGGGGGETINADTEFDGGFRTGVVRAIGDCTSVAATFAQFRSHNENGAAESNDGAEDVQSLVMPPASSFATGFTSLVQSSFNVDFQTVDAEFRTLLSGSDNYAINGIAGARYGRLEQRFEQRATYNPGNSQGVAATEIDFDGVGLRLGLDGERQVRCSPLSLYGKSFINVLFGDFDSSYQLRSAAGPIVITATDSWSDERAVPVLELELGASWTEGNWRLSSGYYAGFWFNSVTTPEFIQGYQDNDYTDIEDTITFHGFVARLECRF